MVETSRGKGVSLSPRRPKALEYVASEPRCVRKTRNKFKNTYQYKDKLFRLYLLSVRTT